MLLPEKNEPPPRPSGPRAVTRHCRQVSPGPAAQRREQLRGRAGEQAGPLVVELGGGYRLV